MAADRISTPQLLPLSSSQPTDPWLSLRIASSVSNFTDTVHNVYCQQLQHTWRTTLQNVAVNTRDNSQDCFIRYDPDIMLDCILYGFDWNDLCRHYDRATRHSTLHSQQQEISNNQNKVDVMHNSPLSIIVSDVILLDPRLVSHACYQPIVQGLLQVLLTNATTRSGRTMTPSQNLLLETMATLVRRSRHIHLGSLVLNGLEKHHAASTFGDDMDGYRFKYSLIKHLSELFPGQETSIQVPGLLCIIQQIDNWDVRLLTTTAATTLSQGSRSSQGGKHDDSQSNGRTKRRTNKFATIGELHGETANDKDKPSMTFGLNPPYHVQANHPQKYPQCPSDSRVTMKEVLRASCCRPNQCTTETATTFTRLPLEAVLLRSKCYKRLLQVVTLHSTSGDASTRDLSRVVDHIICFALRHHPNSAASRLCLVLLADVATEAGIRGVFQLLVDRLMNRIAENLNPFNAEQVWRLYCELLVDGCHFDSRHNCWQAMQPLVQAIKNATKALSAAEASTLSGGPVIADSAVKSSLTPPPSLQLLLRSLAYILSKRRRLLTSNLHDALGQKIQAFTTTLSIFFGHESYWIASSSTMDIGERESIVLTLQLLGIVGIVSNDFEDDSELTEGHDDVDDTIIDGSLTHNDENTTKPSATIWPFAAPNTIRCAYRRMGPKVCNRRLLSPADHDLHVAQANEQKQVKETMGQADVVRPPALEYFNDDTLGIVFSYFGYKRLVWVRQVCKTWKDIADQDTLWKDVYVARFRPVMPEDDGLPNCQSSSHNKSMSWKELFKSKYRAERRIRFLRDKKTGWKVRTCGHLGCLEVLRNPDRLKRHYEAHCQKKVDGCSKRKRKETPGDQKCIAKSSSNKNKPS